MSRCIQLVVGIWGGLVACALREPPDELSCGWHPLYEKVSEHKGDPVFEGGR
jgi:hypothetical protein